MFNTSVISGKGRGKGMGFPTLNLQIPAKLDAQHGIYAGWVWIGEEKFQGAFHYGPIPTFQDAAPSLEVYLLDSDIEIPPKVVRFELVERLREVRTFDSVPELVAQIDQDVKKCREILQQTSSSSTR